MLKGSKNIVRIAHYSLGKLWVKYRSTCSRIYTEERNQRNSSETELHERQSTGTKSKWRTKPKNEEMLGLLKYELVTAHYLVQKQHSGSRVTRSRFHCGESLFVSGSAANRCRKGKVIRAGCMS